MSMGSAQALPSLIANLALPIGTHEVLFQHPTLGQQKQTIVVRVEGMTRVSATLQK